MIGYQQRFTAGLHLAKQLQGLGLEVGFRDLPRRIRGQRRLRRVHRHFKMTMVIRLGQVHGCSDQLPVVIGQPDKALKTYYSKHRTINLL